MCLDKNCYHRVEQIGEPGDNVETNESKFDKYKYHKDHNVKCA